MRRRRALAAAAVVFIFSDERVKTYPPVCCFGHTLRVQLLFGRSFWLVGRSVGRCKEVAPNDIHHSPLLASFEALLSATASLRLLLLIRLLVAVARWKSINAYRQRFPSSDCSEVSSSSSTTTTTEAKSIIRRQGDKCVNKLCLSSGFFHSTVLTCCAN